MYGTERAVLATLLLLVSTLHTIDKTGGGRRQARKLAQCSHTKNTKHSTNQQTTNKLIN